MATVLKTPNSRPSMGVVCPESLLDMQRPRWGWGVSAAPLCCDLAPPCLSFSMCTTEPRLPPSQVGTDRRAGKAGGVSGPHGLTQGLWRTRGSVDACDVER